MSEQGSSLTARAAWFMFAKTLAFAFSFALPLLLVRRLSQHEFGLYKQVFLIVTTAVTTIPIGFGLSAFYFLPRERELKGQIAFNILLFYAIVGGLACLALFLHPTLLATIFNSSDLTEYGPLIGVVCLLWIISSILDVIVIANQEAGLAAVLIIVSGLTRALLLLAAAIWFDSVRALIYAAVIQGTLQTAILLWYLRSRFAHLWRGFDWAIIRLQLSYALPFGASSLLLRLHSDLHNYFVSHEFGAAAYAIYSIGCFNLPLVDILSEAVGSVMIPRVSYLQSLGRRREIIELIARMMRKLAAVYFPLYVFLLIFGREFIVTLFTKQYLASWPIFVVNLTLVPLGLFLSAYDPVIRAYAEHRYFQIKVRAVLLVVLLAALWFGIIHFGMLGAITAVVGVTLMERLVIAFKVGRILGITRRDFILLDDLGKLAVAAIAAGMFAALVRSVALGAKPFVVLAVCGVVFSLVYVGAVLLLAVVTVDEREAIRRWMALMQRFTPRKRTTNPLG